MAGIKAVILSAGKGTRWLPLTLTHQKTVYKVGPFSILEHNLNEINGLVKEAIIVVKYNKEEVVSLLGNEYKGIKIKYVLQKKFLGTGDAAKSALPFLKGRFILFNGDDLYDKDDIKRCIKKFPCVLVSKLKNPSLYGQIVVKGKEIGNIAEKPKKIISNLVNTGFYFLDKSIFNYKIKKSERGEFEFTDYLKKFIAKNKLYFYISKKWLPVSNAWDLLEAGKFFLKNAKPFCYGKIEKPILKQGKLLFGKNSIIKAGNIIKGPVYIGDNVVVENNCRLENGVILGNNSLVGKGSIIKNSIVGCSSKIGKGSYIVNSIIAPNCSLAENVKILSSNSENRQGVILADFSRVAKNVKFYSGTRVWPGKSIASGKVVRSDIN